MALTPTVLVRGLHVESEVYLGAFPPTEGPPDVVVRVRPARALAMRTVRPGCFETRGRDAFIGVPGNGVVMVRAGREIWIDPSPGMNIASMLPAVLGAAMDILMEQRMHVPGWQPIKSHVLVAA